MLPQTMYTCSCSQTHALTHAHMPMLTCSCSHAHAHMLMLTNTCSHTHALIHMLMLMLPHIISDWQGGHIQLARSTVYGFTPCTRCKVLRQCTPAQVSTACLDRGRAATCHTGHTWGVLYVASFPPSSSFPTSRTKGAPTEHPCCATCQSEVQGVSSCA